MFDRLDARIALSSGVVATGATSAATVLAISNTSTMPGEDSGTVPPTGWFEGGTPPSTSTDPLNPPIPVVYQTPSSIAAN